MGSDDVENVEPSVVAKRRLTGREARRAHATLGLGLAICVAAFWFEIGRALGGNSLSWAYVFEWPLLGAFAVYMWWKVVHPDVEGARPTREPTIAPEFDGMLAAWREHQEDLTRANDEASSHEPDRR